MWTIGTCVSALIVAWLTHWIYQWKNPKCNGVLPPGSSGLPLTGETLQLMVPSYSLDLLPFLKKRIERYGKTFRTSLASRPMVVSADPEFCHFVFRQDGKLFESWALDPFAKLFAQEGEASTNIPNVHKCFRSTVVKHFGVEVLRKKLLPLMEEASRVAIESWLGQESVDVKYAAGTMAIHFGAKQLLSYDPKPPTEKLGDVFFSFVQGLMSIPLNIPGTTHYKCMKGESGFGWDHEKHCVDIHSEDSWQKYCKIYTGASSLKGKSSLNMIDWQPYLEKAVAREILVKTLQKLKQQ